MSKGKDIHRAIFNQEVATIEIAGEDIPIKFSLAALEEVQEKYGTLTEYEKQLKGLQDKRKKKTDPPSIKAAPVIDGLIAMIHNGCMAKDYDLAGVTDRELRGALEGNFWELRELVLTEFNKNFIEPDEDEKK